MTTQNHNNRQNLVQDLRKIRDQISSEIKEMTFDEERAYLDKLLSNNQPQAPNAALAITGLDTKQ